MHSGFSITNTIAFTTPPGLKTIHPAKLRVLSAACHTDMQQKRLTKGHGILQTQTRPPAGFRQPGAQILLLMSSVVGSIRRETAL
jgi:hypothetical protein